MKESLKQWPSSGVKFYPKKQSSKIKHKASDGTGYTENQIKAKLSEAYSLRYNEQITYLCEDCGKNQATESSHIIAKARCKQLHKTELIWDKNNFYPSCRECHMRWEANDSTLVRYWQLMEYVKKHDLEGYLKRINL